jgi:hypothetical protein
MKLFRVSILLLFIAVLQCGTSVTTARAQEPSKQKPGTTLDTWKQSLPSAEQVQSVEETTGTSSSIASGDETKKMLLSLEQTWMESVKVGDADSLNQILSTDFMFTSPRLVDGKDRVAYLKYSLSESKLVSYELNRMTVRLFGRTAIVSGLLKQTSAVKGMSAAEEFLVTDVWLNREGVWRVVSRHESPVVQAR